MSDEVEVREVTVVAEPTAVVRHETRWGEFGPLIRPSLDRVYEWLGHGEVRQTGPNVILYLGSKPTIEIGVVVSGPFDAVDGVEPSALPAGRTAMAVHRGPYDRLGVTHDAVQAWCAAQGKAMGGASWERYGDWVEDPEQLETEVHYLLG